VTSYGDPTARYALIVDANGLTRRALVKLLA
jgi:hypothetical protein